jgi:hypothetical protein
MDDRRSTDLRRPRLAQPHILIVAGDSARGRSPDYVISSPVALGPVDTSAFRDLH